MVTEVVEIIIRERGASGTSRRIRSVGSASRTAAKAVTALVIALGSLAAIRAFGRLAQDAVAASAAFEGFGVRLRGLLGSQKEANLALETFVDLSAKTPFAVAQIVEGATSLAASALGNRAALEELTQTAANLAAVTGLSFQQAAENLARSLQAGIGAADLFRERGVRALIEEIGGIPDATKLTATELDEAFRQIFGGGGVFGQAAEALSFTLGGALSNVGDAAANFKVALGDALSPVVINAARQVFIPFFTNLEDLVAENDENIADFAAGAMVAMIDAFILASEVGLSFLGGLSSIRQFIVTLTASFFQFSLIVKESNVALTRLLDSFGLAPSSGEGSLAAQVRQLELAQAAFDVVADDIGAANRESDRFRKGLDALRESLQGLKSLADTTNFTELIRPADEGPSVEDLTGGGAGTSQTVAQLKEIVDSQKELAALDREIALERASGGDAIQRQIILLDEQIARAVELGRLTGDQATAERVINGLIEERTALATGPSTEVIEAQETLSALAREIAIEQASGGDAIARQIILLDEQIVQVVELARLTGDQAAAEEIINGLIAQRVELVDQLAGPDFAEQFSTSVASGLSSGFERAIRSGDNLADSLGNAFEKAAQDSLISGFDSAFEALGEGLDGVLSAIGDQLPDIFGDSAIGEALGGVISGAIQFVALQAISAIFGGGGNRSSSSSANVQSAVTSTEAVRGIVAGPQEIAIAQVDRAIGEAIAPATEELRTQTVILRAIVQAIQSSGGSVAGFDADTGALATGSAPLASA